MFVACANAYIDVCVCVCICWLLYNLEILWDFFKKFYVLRGLDLLMEDSESLGLQGDPTSPS